MGNYSTIDISRTGVVNFPFFSLIVFPLMSLAFGLMMTFPRLKMSNGSEVMKAWTIGLE